MTKDHKRERNRETVEIEIETEIDGNRVRDIDI